MNISRPRLLVTLSNQALGAQLALRPPKLAAAPKVAPGGPSLGSRILGSVRPDNHAVARNIRFRLARPVRCPAHLPCRDRPWPGPAAWAPTHGARASTRRLGKLRRQLPTAQVRQDLAS